MLYNKNSVRKTNDKKILHKVGKQWKVVSVALLMAVAGGAVAATHANADTNSDAQALETPVTPNNAFVNAPAAQKYVPKQGATVNNKALYWTGHNGSAASYFDDAAAQGSTAAKNFATVNSYVQVLNGEYGVQVNSFEASANSAKSASANDSKLASSYSATTKNASMVSSVTSSEATAHKAVNPAAYEQQLQWSEGNFSGAVQSASSDAKAASVVYSLASEFEDQDPITASMDASSASVEASSVAASADSVYASVVANKATDPAVMSASNANLLFIAANRLMDNGNGNTDYQNYLANAINDLSYGAGYTGNSLATEKGFASSVVTSYASSEASATVSANKAALSTAMSNDSKANDNDSTNTFNTYAVKAFQNPNVVPSNSLAHYLAHPAGVTSTANNAYALNDDNYVGDASTNFSEAVSNKVNYDMGQYLQSLANSVLDANASASAQAATDKKDHASMVASAKMEKTYADYMSNVTAANSVAMSVFANGDDDAAANTTLASGTVYSAGTSAGSYNFNTMASVAANYMSAGVNGFFNSMASAVADHVQSLAAGTTVVTPAQYSNYVSSADLSTFENSVADLVVPVAAGHDATAAQVAEQKLVKDLLGNGQANAGVNAHTGNNVKLTDVEAALNKVATLAGTLDFTQDTKTTDTDVAAHTPLALSNKLTAAQTNLEDFLSGMKWSADAPTAAAQKALFNGDPGNTLLLDALAAAGNAGVTLDADNYKLSTPTDVSLQNLKDALNLVAGDATKAATKAASINAPAQGAAATGVNAVKEHNEVTRPDYTKANDALQNAFLSDGVDFGMLKSLAGNFTNVKNAATSADVVTSNGKAFTSSNDSNYVADQMFAGLSAAENSADTALASAQNSLASFNNDNDTNVTLASYFASSYASDATSEGKVASAQSSALNSFYVSATDNDATFSDADSAYQSAESASSADYTMGKAEASWVYNHASHYLDVLKGAKLHKSVDFGSKADKTLGYAKKGDRLEVLGVNFGYASGHKGTTRYYVLDHTTGKKGFFTAQPSFTTTAYLNSTEQTRYTSVLVLKPVKVYSALTKGKVVGSLKKGDLVSGVTVVPAAPDNDAMGYTKVETSNGQFFTANTQYVTLNLNALANNTKVAPSANNNEQPSADEANGQLYYK